MWSAACSTGEEPFSLAMTLAARFPASEGWTFELLGSDLSRRALATAERATWPMSRASTIDPELLHRFMLCGTGSQEGKFRAAPELRERVQFRRLNLTEAPFPDLGRFDLLFCRNVLMYFDAPTKRAVVSGLLEHLAPGGAAARRPRREPGRNVRRPDRGAPDDLRPRRRLGEPEAAVRVLVVDDSAVVREGLATLLGAEPGVEVSTASDPLIAIQKMKVSRPDVILLDLQLPRMDGLSFLRRLGEAPERIPVVVCSALSGGNGELALEALEAGAVEVVAKPALGVREFLEESRVTLLEALRGAVSARRPALRPRGRGPREGRPARGRLGARG